MWQPAKVSNAADIINARRGLDRVIRAPRLLVKLEYSLQQWHLVRWPIVVVIRGCHRDVPVVADSDRDRDDDDNRQEPGS